MRLLLTAILNQLLFQTILIFSHREKTLNERLEGSELMQQHRQYLQKLLKRLIPGILLCLIAMTANAQERGLGSVSGIVLDQQGNPVIGATVYVQPAERPINGRLPHTITDHNGRFYFSNLIPENIIVRAFKETEGYPDTFFAIYTQHAPLSPEVSIYEGQTSHVTVQLGAKLNKLQGQVIDGQSGQPVAHVSYTLYRRDNPNIYYTTSSDADKPTGSFEILLPPDVALKITAQGYEVWDSQSEMDAKEWASFAQPATTGIRQFRIVLKSTQ
ncbi:MAG: carboxypeptidase-like regulatory domain-containing protein [Acidobacteriota bacterium]